MVAVHLQTALRSPPVAVSAFSLKVMAPPYVTRNQLYNGRDPLLAMPLVALFLTWYGPAMMLWLPRDLYSDYPREGAAYAMVPGVAPPCGPCHAWGAGGA
jgi:hypothetical protein